MTSLYKRATPLQRRLLNIVAGAVVNTAHAHPEAVLTTRFARSVAKRAVGTLTAQLSVLAPRSAASCESANKLTTLHSTSCDKLPSQLAEKHGTASHRASRRSGGNTSGFRRSAYVDIWAEVSRMIYAPKKAGRTEYVEALVDVLKMIAAKQKAKSDAHGGNN